MSYTFDELNEVMLAAGYDELVEHGPAVIFVNNKFRAIVFHDGSEWFNARFTSHDGMVEFVVNHMSYVGN